MRRGSQLSGPGGEAPQAVGGRKAHGPTAEKDFTKDINTKERRKGIRSAIAATADPDTVAERGHRFDGDLPLVADDGIERIERTADVIDVLRELGLGNDLARVQEPAKRAGKGKNRGRPNRPKVGPLLVVAEDGGIGQAARNIPGVEVAQVQELNAELLAPGAQAGRLVVWSEAALERLDEEGMFQ
jgi:large subunit ribosomal protein L4e